MLLFLIAFLYSARPYYDHERIICMAHYLINVQAKNRLEQKGLLKRFNTNCYGYEKTIIELRSEKAEKYEQLKNDKNEKEYNKYFYKYVPGKNTVKSDYHKEKYHHNTTKKNQRNPKKNNFGNVLFDKFF